MHVMILDLYNNCHKMGTIVPLSHMKSCQIRQFILSASKVFVLLYHYLNETGRKITAYKINIYYPERIHNYYIK